MKKLTVALLFLGAAAKAQLPAPPPVEERIRHVSERISRDVSLTPAQKTKVESAYRDFFNSMEHLRKANGKPEMPPPPPPPGKKEDVDKLVKARDAKIRSVLSDAQFKKYAEIEKTLRPPGPPPAGQRN